VPDRFILESASGAIVSLKVPDQQGGVVLTVVTMAQQKGSHASPP